MVRAGIVFLGEGRPCGGGGGRFFLSLDRSSWLGLSLSFWEKDGRVRFHPRDCLTRSMLDRKSVVSGKRVDLGGRRNIKKKKNTHSKIINNI